MDKEKKTSEESRFDFSKKNLEAINVGKNKFGNTVLNENNPNQSTSEMTLVVQDGVLTVAPIKSIFDNEEMLTKFEKIVSDNNINIEDHYPIEEEVESIEIDIELMEEKNGLFTNMPTSLEEFKTASSKIISGEAESNNKQIFKHAATTKSVPINTVKFCRYCGNKFEEIDKFCINCGNQRK